MEIKMKPTSVIKARLGLQAGGKLQKYFTNNCYKHMDKYVPKQNENLRTNVQIEPDFIIYKSRHAHYQYRGILYVDRKTGKGAFFNENYGFWSRPDDTKVPSNRKLTYHTPGTGSYWDKRMWSVEKDKVISETQKFFDRGCK